MTILFEPKDETPEGWRSTILGALACKFGWHFGQIAYNDMIKCSRCKSKYYLHPYYLLLHDQPRPYFLPKRSIIIKVGSGDLRDNFIGYKCVDCGYMISDAQKIVDHQRQWHNWRTWWKRLKAS